MFVTYSRSQLVTNIEAVLYYKYRVLVWLFFYCPSHEYSSLYPEIRHLSLWDVCMFVCMYVCMYVCTYEGCPESIRPFWISQAPVAWPWCNLAASQRRPYCASVNGHSPVGLVSRQWDAVDWACVLCDRRFHNDRTSRSISSRQCACPFYSSRAGLFGKSSHRPGLSAPLQPRFGSLRLLDFPRAIIAVVRQEICECYSHTVHGLS